MELNNSKLSQQKNINSSYRFSKPVGYKNTTASQVIKFL